MLLQLDEETGDKSIPCLCAAAVNRDRNAAYRSFSCELASGIIE